jgi:HSP20 family protein
MAREKQVEQNKKQSTTANTSSTSSNRSTESTASTPSSASSPVSERERNIETGREQGRDRSMATRPYSSAVHSQSSSPFSLMRRMAEDMDNLFEHFGLGRGALTLPSAFGGLSDDLWSTPALRQPAWTPQVEVIQRGEKIVVRADLPGLKKEDISVEINDGVLSISGERKDEREESRDGFYRSERSYGQFYRAIPLPDGVSADAVDAKFNDGVLEITLDAPTQEQNKAKRIQIR